MRLAFLPLLLLAATACSRSHAPSQAANGPKNPDAAIAQSVPPGGAPAPAASLAGAMPVAVDAATGQPDTPPDKSDKRWQDVDPNTLGGRDENELAKFQAEQRKRDAELMAQDANEANSRVARGAPRDEGADERYADSREDRYFDPRDDRREADDRYADDRYADRRGDDRRYDPRDDERDVGDYGDDGYGDLPPDEGAWDESDYDEPPYDEDDYPPPDEDYDPRYERPYR